MDRVSVVIPIIGFNHITDRCLEVLYQSSPEIELILVINGGEVELTPQFKGGVQIIKNEKNIGCFPALLQGIEIASNDIVTTMHNDVLIWEKEWPQRILSLFKKNKNLAVAGFFGAPMVHSSGNRVNPHSNMKGLEWGSPGKGHGAILKGTYPAAVFDSVVMIFNRRFLEDIKLDDLPPHHWFDKLIPMRFNDAGYKCLTVGVPFDHLGSILTYQKPSSLLEDFSKEWCIENNIPPLLDRYDYALYDYGRKLFEEEWLARIPQLITRPNTSLPDLSLYWADDGSCLKAKRRVIIEDYIPGQAKKLFQMTKNIHHENHF